MIGCWSISHVFDSLVSGGWPTIGESAFQKQNLAAENRHCASSKTTQVMSDIESPKTRSSEIGTTSGTA